MTDIEYMTGDFITNGVNHINKNIEDDKTLKPHISETPQDVDINLEIAESSVTKLNSGSIQTLTINTRTTKMIGEYWQIVKIENSIKLYIVECITKVNKRIPRISFLLIYSMA